MSYVIALDIGGTKIEGALVSKAGAVSHTKKVYVYDGDSKAKIINHILYVVQFLKHITSYKIEGVGVSVAGRIDKGVIKTSHNLKNLKNVNLKKLIESKIRLKTVVENDANCFALAEAVYGKYNNSNAVVGLIWGTGIGSGIVVDKEIVKGMGGAGEIGHIKLPVFIDHDKKHHYTIEQLCGGKHISTAYGKSVAPSKILTLKDAKAKKISKIVISSLAWTVASIIKIINPDVIVFGGGVSTVPQTVYNKIIKATEKYCEKELITKTKIVKYSLRNDAGLLGAAYLVTKKL